MGLTYVIPDIHGRYDLLSEAMAAITARSGGEAGAIVMLGDYVDKGPDSKQVIDTMLSGVAVILSDNASSDGPVIPGACV